MLIKNEIPIICGTGGQRVNLRVPMFVCLLSASVRKIHFNFCAAHLQVRLDTVEGGAPG